jgi:hypothetical protein
LREIAGLRGVAALQKDHDLRDAIKGLQRGQSNYSIKGGGRDGPRAGRDPRKGTQRTTKGPLKGPEGLYLMAAGRGGKLEPMV